MMKIQKAVVEYKERKDIICMYGSIGEGENEIRYYFLGDDETKKFSNGNRVVTSSLTEAVDPMIEPKQIGMINKKGDVIIPLENRAIKPISNKIILVEKSTPVSQSVIDAVEHRKDSLAVSGLVSTSAAIKDAINAKMGPEGRFIFNDQFSEATICDIDGNNLVGGEYYSYISNANDLLYLSKNVANSEIAEFSISKGEFISNETIDVNAVGVDPAVVDNALASETVVQPDAVQAAVGVPAVDPNAAMPVAAVDPNAAMPTVDAADAPVVDPAAIPAVEGAVAPEVAAADPNAAMPTVDAAGAPVVDPAAMPAVEGAVAPEVAAVDGTVVPEMPVVNENEVPTADNAEVEPNPLAGFEEFFNVSIPADAVEAKDGFNPEDLAGDAPVTEEATETTQELDSVSETSAENAEQATENSEEVATPPVVDVAAELQNIEVSLDNSNKEETTDTSSLESGEIESSELSLANDAPLVPSVQDLVEDNSAEEEKTEEETKDEEKEEKPEEDEVVEDKEEEKEPEDKKDPEEESKEEVKDEEPEEEKAEKEEKKEEDKEEEEHEVVDIFKEHKEKAEKEEDEDKNDFMSLYDTDKDEEEDRHDKKYDDIDLDLDDRDYRNVHDYGSNRRRYDDYMSRDTDLDLSDSYSDDTSSSTFMDDVTKSMAKLVRQNKEQRSTISKLESTVASMDSKNRNLTDKYKSEVEKTEMLTGKLRNLDSLYTRLEEKDHEKDRRIESLQRTVRSLKEQINGKRDLVNALRDAQQLLDDDRDSYYDDEDSYIRRRVA